ncbi:hypothetical protein GE09DRAFT_1083753 [Coniochaeta sp. 2T2.1]|nr:hypothetical protein GE09DRAFT_1083753 [Coniochaeta sp. 2T2.1]
MSSTAVVQFTLLKLKPDAHLDEVGSPGGDALLDVISVVKKADKNNRAFFGHQLENPDIGVLVFVYPSLEASKVFTPSSSPKLSSFSTSASLRTFKFSPADSLLPVFTAGTTEVATGYGAEPGYEKNMRGFNDVIISDLKDREGSGFHGSVVGVSTEDISKEERGDKGPAVTLVVGWDSKEKHMEGKELGSIPDKIGLIRVLRREMDMWHVIFKEY